MGILDQYNQTNINMKVFISLSTLLAVASAAPAQHSHQSIHKDGLAIHTVGHTAHGGHAAAHSVVAPIHHAGFHGHHAPHHAAPVHHAPAVVHHEQGPAAYNYGYAVADSYSGVNFGATEARDGYATTGSYNVLLPDGRTQTLPTLLEMITPDMLPMFNTLVNPHL